MVKKDVKVQNIVVSEDKQVIVKNDIKNRVT